MLTKKDFIKLAEIAGTQKDPAIRQIMVENFIEMGKASNPRFNTQKFKDFVSKLAERM
jgi:hypothetical protein